MIVATKYGEVTQIKMSRYPNLPSGTHVSAYLVDGLLIDTGPAYTAQELVDYLHDKKVDLVVNTHHHEDHIAANALLQEKYGVDILAHALAVDRINQPAVLYPYQEEVWGYPIPSQVKAIGSSVATEQYRFEVVHTPGHDRDHICFFEQKQGWLIAGDLYVSNHPSAIRPQDRIWPIIADMKKIRALQPRMLFTSIGKVIDQPIASLEQVIDRLEELGEKIAALSAQGLSPEHIVRSIFGEETPLADFTQQQFSWLNLVKSFLEME